MHQHSVGEDPKEYYWLIGSDYSQTKPEWEYLAGIFRSMGLFRKESNQRFPSDGKKAVIYVGMANWPLDKCAVIETKSASKDNLEKIAGFPLMGAILCEAAQLSEDAFKKDRGRTTQKRKDGSWMLLVGTFEGSLGWYPRMFERWENGNAKEEAIAVSCPSWENEVVYPGGENDPAIVYERNNRTYEDFMERLGGRPCPPKGGVMAGSFDYTVHVNEEMATFDSDEVVYLAHDLGSTHAASALAIQLVPNGSDIDTVCVVDEVYVYDTLCQNFITAVMQKKWFPNVSLDQSVADRQGSFKDFRAEPAVKQWKDRTA